LGLLITFGASLMTLLAADSDGGRSVHLVRWLFGRSSDEKIMSEH
jgi:hypothetical protein